MKKYNTILWDLDGTLLDFKESEKYALRVCLADYGVTFTDELLQIYSGINESYWKRLEKGEVTKKELLSGRFRDFFAQVHIQHIDPEVICQKYQVELGTTTCYCDDSYTIVDTLKKDGFHQYMVTNGVITTQKVKLKNSHFDALFDGVFISDELGFEKPHPEFFNLSFAQIPDFDPQKTILIGDSLTSDMQGANAAGVTACWYNPLKLSNDTAVHIDYEIRDLHEVLDLLKR